MEEVVMGASRSPTRARHVDLFIDMGMRGVACGGCYVEGMRKLRKFIKTKTVLSLYATCPALN
jgi:hypothetical protein